MHGIMNENIQDRCVSAIRCKYWFK